MGFDKQALRQTAEKAQEHGVFNMDIHSETALALLDELETKEEQRANWFQMAQKLGEDLDAAEKRVAELEARTVKLPEPISVLHRRDFNDAHRAIYAYPEAEVDAALAAAGIGKGE
ncbi:Uncharacterised protein [Citrobacter amalonaticus]|uniref:Ead/Ea22-like family protein n=1 Tax=Citrobacter amalonaticus TaxID=35703 RepID=A0A6N2XV94_CITAM